jgi:DNA invertase Pin-like site-specific DNA recombinase
VAKREAREKLIEAARRREINLVLVWRLDRWGRSITDLLATLQELEHLGVGFVSLMEALGLTTAAGRAMAGLRAIFAEFEREILRERTGLAWLMRGRMGNGWVGRQPQPFALRKSKNYIAPALANPKSLAACGSGAHQSAESWEHNHEKTQARPGSRRPDLQRGNRRCSSGRAGHELVLLSGGQDQLPIPGKVRRHEGRLAAPPG